MNLTSGVDVIEIERIQKAIERHGERFLKRIYTPLELVEAGKSTASLAARFSAKEAVAKALGCGIGPVSWQEIEIRRGPANRPELALSGEAARLAEEQGLNHWTISLSHSQQHAVALAVALRAD